MATFIVKTIEYRNLVIKAEKFVYNSDNHNYEFTNGTTIVASVSGREVFAVLDKESEQVDFILRDDWSEDQNREAHALLDRATDLLIGQTTEEDDPTFWDEYFDFIGEPPIDEDEPASAPAPEETNE